jgi:hypothetical protein
MTYVFIIIFILLFIITYFITKSFEGFGSDKDIQDANMDTFSQQLTGRVKVAGPDEFKKASQFALEMLCSRKGYQVDKYDLDEQSKELGFRCKHTEQTCKRDSRFPSTSKNPYTIWDNTINECKFGLEEYRNFCNKQDKLLKYNIEDETCKTTRIYCMSKLEKFDGDCYKDFITTLFSFMFGDFMGKIMAKIANSFTILGLISMVESGARQDDIGAMGLLGVGDIIELSRADFDTRTYKVDDF